MFEKQRAKVGVGGPDGPGRVSHMPTTVRLHPGHLVDKTSALAQAYNLIATSVNTQPRFELWGPLGEIMAGFPR